MYCYHNASQITYPGNTSSNYTVKLPKNIYLPESDWEVALGSISFPDLISQVVESEDTTYDLKTRIPMIMNHKMFCKVLYDDGKSIPVKKDGKNVKDIGGGTLYYHHVGGPIRLDLEELGTRFPKSIQSGNEIWTRMTNLLTDRMYRTFEDVNDIRGGQGKRLSDWKSAVTKKGHHPYFEWVPNADSYDLKINNENVEYLDVFNRTQQTSSGPITYFLEELTILFLNENYVDIELELAKRFHILEQVQKDGKTETNLTSSVRIEHFRDPILEKAGQDPKAAGLWKVVTYKPLAHDQKITITYVRFYSFLNWYFSGLNEKFQHTYVDPKRTLYVYSDLAQTQIVGGRETDLLREVTISNSVKGRRLYEPLHLQYLPIRKNVFDTVEVGVSETDGTLTKFRGQTILTILTVNFRRQSNQSALTA